MVAGGGCHGVGGEPTAWVICVWTEELCFGREGCAGAQGAAGAADRASHFVSGYGERGR